MEVRRRQGRYRTSGAAAVDLPDQPRAVSGSPKEKAALWAAFSLGAGFQYT
jgi:hypothetical protein